MTDTRETQRHATDLLEAIRHLRREMGDVTLMRVEVLLTVAQEANLSQRELCDRLHASRAGISAAVMNLTDEDALRRPGPGYLSQTVDPNERRRKLLNLTEKGRRLVKAAVNAFKRTHLTEA